MATQKDDALLQFKKLHRHYAPGGYRERHEAAAKRLCAEFLELAKSHELPTHKEHGNDAINFGQSGTIVLFVDRVGEISLREIKRNNPPPATQADLEFDPLADTIVGKHVDPDITPVAGETPPRVHPIKVLTKLAASLLADA